jgi:hypothetical protein
MMPCLPKRELHARMDRFLADKGRLISLAMFSDLAGISESQIRDVFRYKTSPMSATVQVAVSKALQEWEQGLVVVMQRKDGSRYLEYRAEARPRLRPHTGLRVVDGRLRLDVGVRNKSDYSKPSLKEQMEG